MKAQAKLLRALCFHVVFGGNLNCFRDSKVVGCSSSDVVEDLLYYSCYNQPFNVVSHVVLCQAFFCHQTILSSNWYHLSGVPRVSMSCVDKVLLLNCHRYTIETSNPLTIDAPEILTYSFDSIQVLFPSLETFLLRTSRNEEKKSLLLDLKVCESFQR